MADYYFYLEVYDARPPHDGGVINPVVGVRRKTSPHFELEFLTEDHAAGGSAKTAFLNHYDDEIVSAPKPINLLASDLRAALNASASAAACHLVSPDPYLSPERIPWFPVEQELPSR